MNRTDMPVAPPLPAGCVDFNALHEAAVRGAQPAAALAAALVQPDAERAPAPGEPIVVPPAPRVPEIGDEVTIEAKGGGWWWVSAPWLDGPEKIQGEELARTRQGDLQMMIPTAPAGAGDNEETMNG